MSYIRTSVAAATFAALVGAVAVPAAHADNAGHALAALAPVGPVTTRAFLTATVQQGGTILHSKGVAIVAHPSVGIYCVKPSAATLVIQNIVALVTVAWGPPQATR
jgi:hypothetical protein